MSSINDTEQKKLIEWASLYTGEKYFYSEEKTEKDSLWRTRKQEDTYIMEYDFDTLPEFEELCKKVLYIQEERKMQRVLSVAVFKNMPNGEVNEAVTKLPEYRYVF